jgi:hypothetical protein
MEAWDMGQNISCDEQMIGFKGNHVDKQRISYKREGGVFLANTICESGYTYPFSSETCHHHVITSVRVALLSMLEYPLCLIS